MLSRIKYLVKGVLDNISNVIKVASSFPNSSNLLVLDIDDTVCNNPLHIDETLNGNLKDVYVNLDFDHNLLNILTKRFPNHDLVFLSARQKKYEEITYKWLEKNLDISFKLYLCGSAARKLFYLKLFLTKYKNLIYVDDLSYFRDGNRFFYNEVRDWSEKNLSVEYIGWDYLKKFRKY